ELVPVPETPAEPDGLTLMDVEPLANGGSPAMVVDKLQSSHKLESPVWLLTVLA
ncbi:MAG: hypothetical protein US06_C0024G0001, partial [Parcubacteria group bacterium GW2011_GWC2_36_17]